jgi:DNA-binding NtrC family response regulator
LGSDKFVRAQVNVITASNRNLEALVREKQFRPDLFFRLAVLRIHMTPLRERRNDIPILARHFFDTLCAEEGVALKVIVAATMTRLQNADWPGTVRELYNVVQRAFAFAEGSQILPYHLNPAGADSARANDERVDGNFRVARARAIEAFEREYVIDLLRAHNWNITQAARSAGQDRRALGRLVKRHNIQREAL